LTFHLTSSIKTQYEKTLFILSLFSANPTVVQRPSIWVIDLKTDSVLSRYEIPLSVVGDALGLANIAIDVIDCKNNNTFAYLPNLSTSQIIVYDLNENKSYRVQHNFFHMHPLQGDYNVDGLMFSWDDAIFSIALSERDEDSTHRLAYFHAMSRFWF
jgi:dopachrome tautomerase